MGQTAHANWIAVRRQQRAQGQVVEEKELRSWQMLADEEKELFRCSGEELALSEEAMWEGVAQLRRKMGETRPVLDLAVERPAGFV